MLRRFTAAVLLGTFCAAGLAALAPAPAQAEMSIRLEKKVVEDLRRGDAEALRAYLLGKGEPDATNNEGEPLLVVATRQNRPDMVELLLRHDARPDKRDGMGSTALYWAADGGAGAIVSTLVDAGARLDVQNDQGLTPLMAAVRKGNMDVVRALIAAGADPRIADYTGRDAFGWATGPRGPLLVNELNKAR
ncbi:ankyrin repeat domain-containing protein [Caenispirillum salinarum]|uniref:ankyrin repeat domain-containing protein n=1 Tax=Caenispirillum salinarum TaxID=859058 RepID=UPI00384B87BB